GMRLWGTEAVGIASEPGMRGVAVQRENTIQTVLFLCSGNYYRSRFAEVYFNWLAGQNALLWRADSRGLALDPANQGPISSHARRGLDVLGVPLPEPQRFPIDAIESDLAAAQLIVALKEAEHRPLIGSRFPAWVD